MHVSFSLNCSSSVGRALRFPAGWCMMSTGKVHSARLRDCNSFVGSGWISWLSVYQGEALLPQWFWNIWISTRVVCEKRRFSFCFALFFSPLALDIQGKSASSMFRFQKCDDGGVSGIVVQPTKIKNVSALFSIRLVYNLIWFFSPSNMSARPEGLLHRALALPRPPCGVTMSYCDCWCLFLIMNHTSDSGVTHLMVVPYVQITSAMLLNQSLDGVNSKHNCTASSYFSKTEYIGYLILFFTSPYHLNR